MHEQLPTQTDVLEVEAKDSRNPSASREIYQGLVKERNGAFKENEAYIRQQIKLLQSANRLDSNVMAPEDWGLLVELFGVALDQQSIPDDDAQKQEWIRVAVENIYASNKHS